MDVYKTMYLSVEKLSRMDLTFAENLNNVKGDFIMLGGHIKHFLKWMQYKHQ